jgi:hypothetical protein
MSSFHNYEGGFANVSCKDTADLNRDVWSYLYRSAMNGCAETRKEFKIQSREYLWLGQLSQQNIRLLGDPVVLHFTCGHALADYKASSSIASQQPSPALDEFQDLAYRFWLSVKLCSHRQSIGVTRIRYGIKTEHIEYVRKLSDAQIRHLVAHTTAGKLELRFDSQLINGIGRADLFKEALSRIQLQCFNSSLEI